VGREKYKKSIEGKYGRSRASKRDSCDRLRGQILMNRRIARAKSKGWRSK